MDRLERSASRTPSRSSSAPETAEGAIRSRMLSYEQIFDPGRAHRLGAFDLAQGMARLITISASRKLSRIQSIGFTERVKHAGRERT